MRVSAWSNGTPSPSGSGYGLKVSTGDRDRYFRREWADVIIELPGEVSTVVSLSPSFWSSCSELRSAAVGRWLMSEGLAPWLRGGPPTVALTPVGDNRFRVETPGG